MERESFESEEIGKLLSQHFVSIKVDREERPDVDKVYMTFIQVKCVCVCVSSLYLHMPMCPAHESMVYTHTYMCI